jgi:cytochrome c oxidase subunit II
MREHGRGSREACDDDASEKAGRSSHRTYSGAHQVAIICRSRQGAFEDGGISLRILATDRRARRLAALLLALAMPLLAACSTQTDERATTDAQPPNLFPGEVVMDAGSAAAGLYMPIFLVAVAIFILVEGLLIYNVLRFRRRKTDTELPVQTHGHNGLEILWTAVPAVIVLVMFIASLAVLTRFDTRAAEPAVTVDVTAFQFQWTFEYPDYGLSWTGTGQDGPEMVVPVDEPVRIRLHSADVIHSFFVPQFFTKLDVVPGRENTLEIVVEEPGTYGGQCAEFCGLAHADMFFSVRAVERPEYEAWLAAEIEAATATPAPAPTPEPGEEPPAAEIVLETATTQDAPLDFTQTILTAPAGTEVTVNYLNDSDIPHNIAFFEGPDAGAPRIAATEVEAGPDNLQSVTFTTPEEPGEYFFHCDVHPVQMIGALVVTAGEPGTQPPAEEPAPTDLVLETDTTPDAPLAFNVTTLTAPAATEVTVNYLNDTNIPHNIAFFEGPDASAPRIAATEVETGPDNLQTVTFTTPSEPGSYFFHCDVHPVQMIGTLEVAP